MCFSAFSSPTKMASAFFLQIAKNGNPNYMQKFLCQIVQNKDTALIFCKNKCLARERRFFKKDYLPVQ
jgi:hypothetical protein